MVNGVVHTYQLNDGQIVSEAWGNNLIVYLYDASGAPIGMMYRTTSYDITDWDVFWFENFNYNQQFIYDESTSIIQDTIEYENDGFNTVLAKKENGGKYDPNPYRRPGEKKQNRENQIKSRQKSNWKPRNNKRDGKPAKPKPHSPSKKGHRKDFNTIIPIDLY